jgi:tetratricopeptide (TPR) repeat protein
MTRLSRLWARRRVAMESDDNQEADRLLAEAIVLRHELGVQRLDPIAFALVREADAAIEAGAVTLAAARLDAAQQLAPKLPEVSEARARLAFAESPYALHRVAMSKVSALSFEWRDFQRRMLLLSDGLLTALVLGVVLGLLFLIAQFVRYGLHLYHDLGQAFPAVMRFVLLATALTVVVLPLFYGIGPFMLVFPAAIALWLYQTVSERAVMVALICALGLAPWVLRAGDRLSDASTGLVGALHALEINPYDQQARATVAAGAKADDADWHAQAVLGSALKRAGQLDEAAQMLSDAATIVTDRSLRGLLFVNLGNTWFGLGRPLAAEDAYRRAAKLLRSDPRPHFNLHRLYLRQRRMPEAEAAFKKASALASQRVAAWNQDDDPGLNRFVVDAPLPASVLTKRALSNLVEPASFAHRIWVGFAGPLPELTAPISAGVTLLACLLLFGLRKRLLLSWPCSRCGRRAEVVIYPERPDGPFCQSCEDLFVHNKPMDRATRFQKESEIERFGGLLRWGGRLCTVLLPGFGALVAGRTVRGVLIAGLALWLMLRLVLPGGVLFGPFSPEMASSMGHWIIVGALALLWLQAAYGVIRTREAS